MRAPLRHPSARAALGLGLVAASPAHAQEPRGDPTAADVLARIEPGSALRVRSRAAGMVEGTFASVTDGGAVLTRGGRARVVPLDDVTEVWTRARATRRGGGIGGGIGALTALAFSLFLVSLPCEEDCVVARGADTVVRGAVLGGVVGAGIGGATGTASHEWRRVYVRRTPPPTGVSGPAGAADLPRLRDGRLHAGAPAREAGATPLRAVGGL